MLNNINKNNPFKVPENYFDNFHKDIMNKIQIEEKPKLIPRWKKVTFWTSLAAAICGIIFSINIFFKSPDQNNIFTSNDEKIYSSSNTLSDEEYFLMYLEDEVYNDAIFNELNQ